MAGQKSGLWISVLLKYISWVLHVWVVRTRDAEFSDGINSAQRSQKLVRTFRYRQFRWRHLGIEHKPQGHVLLFLSYTPRVERISVSPNYVVDVSPCSAELGTHT
ncbi:hypothetical protein GGX14DRAFT_387717 [Mycena pura]|uniref:Uncharacterized protein n=1 Tax=Mycena pura TaxID=153505 RepID=A0AAD6YM33_9AGAR|nr:hypothetical protein GGX14DRAFT_387717 [Mycena pura]